MQKVPLVNSTTHTQKT